MYLYQFRLVWGTPKYSKLAISIRVFYPKVTVKKTKHVFQPWHKLFCSQLVYLFQLTLYITVIQNPRSRSLIQKWWSYKKYFFYALGSSLHHIFWWLNTENIFFSTKWPFLGSMKWPHFHDFGNIYFFYVVTSIKYLILFLLGETCGWNFSFSM